MLAASATRAVPASTNLTPILASLLENYSFLVGEGHQRGGAWTPRDFECSVLKLLRIRHACESPKVQLLITVSDILGSHRCDIEDCLSIEEETFIWYIRESQIECYHHSPRNQLRHVGTNGYWSMKRMDASRRRERSQLPNTDRRHGGRASLASNPSKL